MSKEKFGSSGALVLLLALAADELLRESVRSDIQAGEERLAIHLPEVVDGTPYFDELGLYLLLNAPSPGHLGDAIPVTWHDLVDRSEIYRGRFVSLDGKFVETQPLRLIDRERYSQPVHSSLFVAGEQTLPVQVITRELLPVLSRGTRVRLRGYYFKFRSDVPRRLEADVTKNHEVLVPVLVGGSIVVVSGESGRTNRIAQADLLILLILGLSLVYFLVRRVSHNARGALRHPGTLRGLDRMDADVSRQPIDLGGWDPKERREDGKPDGE